MKYVKIGLQLFVVAWAVWTFTGRSPEPTEPEPSLRVVEQVGTDTVCDRNIVGIQPYMMPADYLTEASFFAKMDAYFQKAQKAGYFR